MAVVSKHRRGVRVAVIIAVVLAVIAAVIIAAILSLNHAIDTIHPWGDDSATPLAEAYGDDSNTDIDGDDEAYDSSGHRLVFSDDASGDVAAVDWDYWQSVNPDVIGWVTVPGTNIDYPIVQAHADNPTYYLHHDVYRNYNYHGCPYLDYRCEDGLDSYNATIFGHHLNDGTMFSQFSNFSNRYYASNHRLIILQTPAEVRTLDVAWVDVVNANVYQNMIWFSDHNAYIGWYEGACSGASVVFDSTVPQHDYMFVTCSYNYWNNERTLSVATVRDESRADVWDSQSDTVDDIEEDISSTENIIDNE